MKLVKTFYACLPVSMAGLALAGAFLMPFTQAYANGPQLLSTADQHAAIVEKIETEPWANSLFEKMVDRVEVYADKVQEDPMWAASRLMMNWDTHHVQAVTKGSRTIGGKGRAPIPTPRFVGARDWKTDYTFPDTIDEYPTYNDQDGKISLINTKTGEFEWVDPSITGHMVRRMNDTLMVLASEAAFIYWVTGEEKYADLAASIMWPYMEGFSHVKAPIILDEKGKGPHRIIGTATYEVIHDKVLEDIAVSYDYLRPYIAASDEIDAAVIEQGIKVFIDRVIAGGGAKGNWNMHQASKIAYGGMVLGPNSQYEDGKGREYYIDVVLNAELPQQRGVAFVVEENIDKETGLWPEAAGYGFGAVCDVIEVSLLVSGHPAGKRAMQNPILNKASLAMRNMAYPNGYSNAVGDTNYNRIDPRAYELMTAWAISQGEHETAQKLSAALQEENASGFYSRDEPKEPLIAITQFVGQLPDADPSALELTPTYFAEPLNIIMLRNVSSNGDPRYALGAAFFGTKGGHMHTNGMAVEIYGAGHVLGFDSGRGSSYWQPDHGEYYRALPSHNTVLVNGGAATYPSHSKNPERMLKVKVESVEPAFGQDASDPNFTYVTGSFHYPKPAASQQRTLAMIRVDDTTAFYFDLFRSKLDKSDDGEYHDWMYHAMADDMLIHNAQGDLLSTESSGVLTSANGNVKGYDYFTHESSLTTDATVKVGFPVELNGEKLAMDLWLLGGSERQVFKVDAPANRGARFAYPESVWDRPRPAMVVRQTGEAWDRPFAVVYEPYLEQDGAKISAVESTGPDQWRVTGEGWTVDLELKGAELHHTLNKK